jgi:bla regulator protein BlaR1
VNVFAPRALYSFGSMTIVALLYVLAAVRFKEKYSARSFYYIGILIIAGFLIPFRPVISIPVSVSVERDGNVTDVMGSAAPEEKTQNGTRESKAEAWPITVTAVLWGVGTVGMVFYYGFRHVRFVHLAERWSREIKDSRMDVLRKEKECLGISSHIAFKNCACISSPMLMKLLHPVILLPYICFPAEELSLVLKHELVHFKRKDLWWKGALILAVSLNWFNPAVRLFARVFTSICEESCDEMVTEKMGADLCARYARMIVSVADEKSKLNTVFSTYFYGGKESMKSRVFLIMNSGQRRFSVALIVFFAMLTVCTGTVFAASEESGTYPDCREEIPQEVFGIKSQEEIDWEMAEAFSEVFDNEFHEEDFPGMIITYDEDGIPIVTDPNVPDYRAVFATGRYEKNGFYSSSDCDSESLVFYILKGQKVEVTDSAYSTKVAKVKYAGATGYMKKGELKF